MMLRGTLSEVQPGPIEINHHALFTTGNDCPSYIPLHYVPGTYRCTFPVKQRRSPRWIVLMSGVALSAQLMPPPHWTFC
eukprot:1129975-Pelagomonas_calceolata.AAC.1